MANKWLWNVWRGWWAKTPSQCLSREVFMIIHERYMCCCLQGQGFMGNTKDMHFQSLFCFLRHSSPLHYQISGAPEFRRILNMCRKWYFCWGIISIKCVTFSLSSSSICPFLKENEWDPVYFTKSVATTSPVSTRVSQMLLVLKY